MVIAEDTSTPSTVLQSNNDIDLKCAEKVTDSDNEEAVAAAASLVENQDLKSSGGDSNDKSSNDARDFTCKPKAIKAQRQNVDTGLLSYQQISMYAFNSPKNPSGISPFQPSQGKRMIFAAYQFVY